MTLLDRFPGRKDDLAGLGIGFAICVPIVLFAAVMAK